MENIGKEGQQAAAEMPVTMSEAEIKTAQGPWVWHYGAVKGLGYFTTAGGKEVVIRWDGDASSRKQGGISDPQWEIFKLAFAGTGRIAVLSDQPEPNWKFDYRFLEAQRP